MSRSPEIPFGARLLAELARCPGGSRVTGWMLYAQIQALKVADREQTARLFHGSEYALLQCIRHEEPAAVAAHLSQRAQAAGQQAAGLSWMLMGLALMPH